MFDDDQFVLTDGSIIRIENIGISFYVSTDVNGYKNGPNRLEQDLFMFQIDDSGKLLPMWASGTVYKNDEFCSKTSTDKKMVSDVITKLYLIHHFGKVYHKKRPL